MTTEDTTHLLNPCLRLPQDLCAASTHNYPSPHASAHTLTVVQIARIVKAGMAPIQAALYNWVKQTGTLRQDPEGPSVGKNRRAYATLNNKCMELRKVGHACA